MESSNYIDIVGVKKSYGGTHALKNAELNVKIGEVHALLGENGAGKSTLMKILTGLEQADGGDIFCHGKKVEIKKPIDARKLGISMIHQELSYEPFLTVAQNIFLGRETTKCKIFLDENNDNQRAQELLNRYGINVDCREEMGNLRIATAQMIEILKSVYSGAILIIMDEPTSSLDYQETQTLFSIIRELKDEGKSVIYISHHMEEIFEIADRATIFRDGEFIATKDIGETDIPQLISLMVGREVNNIYNRTDCEIGETVLEVKNLTGKGFSDVSFSVHKGEILGLFGLVGSGRSEIMNSIFGMSKIKSGEIYLNGKKIFNKSPGTAVRNGIAMVNEERKAFGVCLFRPIRENIALPTLRFREKGPFINSKREKETVSAVSSKLSIKTKSYENDAFSLSGGNQQKVVLAKWLLSNPKVLILDEPTKGVDVVAKSEIHRLISEQAARGVAIIMVSSELPEVIGMSDRIMIVHNGKIKKEVMRQEILENKVNQDDIMVVAFGQ